MESRIGHIRLFLSKEWANITCLFLAQAEVFIIICRLLLDSKESNRSVVTGRYSYECRNETAAKFFETADCFVNIPEFTVPSALFHSISLMLLSVFVAEVALRLLVEDWKKRVWQYAVPITDTVIVTMCFLADIVFAFVSDYANMKAFLLVLVFRFARLIPLCKSNESLALTALKRDLSMTLKDKAWLICECRRLKLELETLRARESKLCQVVANDSEPVCSSLCKRSGSLSMDNFASALGELIVMEALQLASEAPPKDAQAASVELLSASNSIVQSDSGYGSVRRTAANCVRRTRGAGSSCKEPSSYVNGAFECSPAELAEIRRVSSVALKVADQPSTSL